ncbi:outer membrane lipoprotein carrier protein LolA [Pseudolysinimonas kribbensis]|uniref:LolA family protein n=1 Tax=Pseudolysinimonas kribbensis TaxID=433641 RepID=UPI0031D426B3
MHASFRTLPALALGVAIPAVVLASALALPAQAEPASTPTAHQLLERVAKSVDQHYSGTLTQTSDLGLPQLPSVGPGSVHSDESAILDLVTAAHRAKVYVDGRSKQRVQVLDQLAERDIVRNGSSVWIWDSKHKTAQHVTLPSRHSASPAPVTPSELATRLLASVRSSSKVTVATGSSVAGRSVDRLVLTPRTDRTLVSRVVVSVDHATGVPLKIAVDARGQSGDAVAIGFTDVSFSTPGAGLFSFSPPKGAHVTTKDLSHVRPHAKADHVAPDPDASASPKAQPGSEPTVTGAGWASVVTVPSGQLPAGVTGDPLFRQLTTAVDGGRALQTTLVSVLITDDGRVLAGAVPIATLEAAAR